MPNIFRFPSYDEIERIDMENRQLPPYLGSASEVEEEKFMILIYFLGTEDATGTLRCGQWDNGIS